MNEILTQIKNLWNKMDTTRRIMVVVVLLLVLGTIIFGVRWVRSPRYELLYSRLSEQDRSEIITKLEELRIPYRTSAGGGIEVPNAVSVRANLLKEGIPRGGVVGWEIFDQSSFSATDFTNQINRQRAISGELTRTLQRLDGIFDAKILLNLPDSTEYIFADDKPEGTVSVQLQLRGPGVLTQAQVESIANLVAASTGVRKENVTIIDNYANDLTAMLRPGRNQRGLPGPDSIADAFGAKYDYENQVERRVESMLSKVFGFNRAVVRVNADLDLDYQEQKSETFADKGVPRSEQEKYETYEGTGSSSVGVPGTDTNITQYKATDSGITQYKAEKSERTTNYEISKVEEFRVAAPGKVKRLTVGVWVDGNLPALTKDKVYNTVAASVGLMEERGDRLTVETIEFSKPAEPEPVEIPWNMIVAAFVGMVLLLTLAIIARRSSPAVKAKKAEEILGEELSAEGLVVGSKIDTLVEDKLMTAEEAAVIEITPEERARNERLVAIEKFAREKPAEVAVLLKAWLSEES
ncbi:MAG: flagellar M-ring protein FliF [Firmicutes bacterium]|nr:flagellar M-ring protein FliF [Bacillota bacterium]